MMRVALLFLSVVGLWVAAAAQASNPLEVAAKAIGSSGLVPGQSAPRGTTVFKPSADRSGVEAFLKEFASSDEERTAFRSLIDGLVESYESNGKAAGMDNEAAGALAFAISLAYSVASGKEVGESEFPAFLGQIRAALDLPAVKAATDQVKQAFYHRCMGMAALVVTLLQAPGQDEATLSKVRQGADGILTSLIGVPSSKVTFGEDGATITGSGPTGGGATTGPSGAVAVRFTAPQGAKEESGWTVMEVTEDNRLHRGMIRLLPSIPASGDMSAAMFDLWRKATPDGLTDRAGGMVFRRYVGNGLFAKFIVGRGREKGRDADTLMSLYMIDVGGRWQPVMVAQTYDVTDGFTVGMDIGVNFSYPKSAELVEQMLAGISAPGVPPVDIVARDVFVGVMKTGSGATQGWVSAVTGASLPDTFVSSGTTYEVKADGTFTYNYVSASGSVGATNFASVSDKGRWRVERDRLIFQGEERTRVYVIAGVTDFTDGTRGFVLLDAERGGPVNAVTVGNMDYYSMKR